MKRKFIWPFLTGGFSDFKGGGDFQRRWGLRSWKSYGESGSENEEALRNFLSYNSTCAIFSFKNIFSADEFGLADEPGQDNCQIPAWREEKFKNLLTYLACTNSDGSENVNLMVIGNSKCPRSFKTAWMNTELFFPGCADSTRILDKHLTKVILLIDTAKLMVK